MKKIVMLNCLRANSVCTGAACLQAFNAKTKTFARYGDEPLELVAFFRCNGCDVPQDDAGMEEKIERLLQLRPDAAHMGVCTRRKADGTRCPTIQSSGPACCRGCRSGGRYTLTSAAGDSTVCAEQKKGMK